MLAAVYFEDGFYRVELNKYNLDILSDIGSLAAPQEQSYLIRYVLMIAAKMREMNTDPIILSIMARWVCPPIVLKSVKGYRKVVQPDVKLDRLKRKGSIKVIGSSIRVVSI